MIIKLVLVAGFLFLAIYALFQRRQSPPLSLLMIVSSLIGCVLAFFPDSTNALAHHIGVGRGADMILYVFVMITFVAIFNLHLRVRASSDVTTELARAIAILAAKPAHKRSSMAH